MKMEIKERRSDWAPVTIQITFETKSELAAWLLMNNDWARQMEEIVREELEMAPEYEKYEPMEACFSKLCGQDVWDTLRVMLDE